MEDVTTALELGLPFNRTPGPNELSKVMNSDPWADLLYPHLDREFFFEKPDTDIFFPVISRYHRGWFQIKPWPHASEPITRPSYAETRPITGGDIPIEVVHHIAETLSVDGASHREPVMHKRELAACALMCRNWTPICQAKIWNRITLRCARDAQELLNFLMDPTCRVQNYIYDLQVPPQKLAGSPWIHHLASLYPYLPHLPRHIEGYRNIDSPIVHTLTGPLRRGLGPLRSIHQALPRAPPIFSSYIQEVHLASVHFRRFGDLADLVGELQDLKYFKCDSLTIAGPQPTPPSALGSMPEVVMRNCNFSWASIWLYTGRHRGTSQWEERIHVEDHKRIGELARTIGSGFEGLHSVPTVKSLRVGYETDRQGRHQHEFQIAFSVSPTQSITLIVTANRRRLPTDSDPEQDDPVTAALHSRILYVSAVRLILSFGEPTTDKSYRFFQDLDWRAFDRIAASFPHLERAQVDFMTEMDFLNFIGRSSHGTMLDELFALNKLAYSIKFKNQPFDWPMGASVAKVGLPPSFGWKMDQQTVLSIKKELDSIIAYAKQITQQESAPSDSDPPQDFIIGASTSGSNQRELMCDAGGSTHQEAVEHDNRYPDTTRVPSHEDASLRQDNGEADVSYDKAYWEDERPRDDGGRGDLQTAISERFPRGPHRLGFIFNDPALAIVHLE